MSKEVDAKGQVWFEQEGNRIKLGLTRNFLSTVLEECWHIIPAYREKIVKGAPLLTIETNDSLISVLSPVSGRVRGWEQRACDFPDQLSEDDTLITVDDGKEVMTSDINVVFSDAPAISAATWNPAVAAHIGGVRGRQQITDPGRSDAWNAAILPTLQEREAATVRLRQQGIIADAPDIPNVRPQDVLDELGIDAVAGMDRGVLVRHLDALSRGGTNTGAVNREVARLREANPIRDATRGA